MNEDQVQFIQNHQKHEDHAKSMKTIETIRNNAHERFYLQYAANCMFQLQNAPNRKGKCPRLKAEKIAKTAPKRCLVRNLPLHLHKKELQLHKEGLQLHRDKPSSKSLKSFFLRRKEIYVLRFDVHKFVSTYVFVLTSSFYLS